jgi:GNAT superfamily N-acetyltransferase
LLAFTKREDVELGTTVSRDVAVGSLRAGDEDVAESGVRIRPMKELDLRRILELRSVVRWSADPNAFVLLRGMRDARWAVAEAPDGTLAGMVGAVPLGRIGILCHLAVRDDYRKIGLGARLSSWAVLYLRSRAARVIRLHSTRQAEGLYLSLGFRPNAARTVYRLEEAPKTMRLRDGADGHWVETLLLGELPELCGVDRWSYGADRSPLILAHIAYDGILGAFGRRNKGSDYPWQLCVFLPEARGYLCSVWPERATSKQRRGLSPRSQRS